MWGRLWIVPAVVWATAGTRLKNGLHSQPDRKWPGVCRAIFHFTRKSKKLSYMIFRLKRLPALSGALLFYLSGAHAADTVNLTAFSCCDGQFITTTVGGQTVWQNIPGSSFLNFNVPASFTFTSGVPVYVRVEYYDDGFGQMSLQYDSVSTGAYASSPRHVRTSRVNTKTFATAYYVLPSPALLNRQGTGADFRLGLGGTPPLSVKSATIQNFPFADPQFQIVLSQPWLQPYSGPSRDDVDRSTLQGKVITGYQGWFRTPNDLADGGWHHWMRNGSVQPTNFNIDMWPDISGYAENELFPAPGIFTRSGQAAKLFSSTTPETVRRHFQWMRKYNIDGAFLQRFVAANSGGAFGGDEFVLNNVRAAAHQEGRIWAIEYDISSLGNVNSLAIISNDWRWLVDVFGVRNDSRYAYEGGKPVVFVWGLPYSDRGIDKTNANAIIDFFKNDPVYGGNYVIGGWPWWWRTITDWNDHFQRYDGALAWMPQNAQGYKDDFNQLASWGIDYFPHVWPGFSWAHLQRFNDESQYNPRGNGAFYWDKIYGAVGSGAGRLFIGMFDEYDEGTAIMPMTDDPPAPAPNWGRFLTNLGKPSDWWLSLTSAARDMMLGLRPYTNLMPVEVIIQSSPDNLPAPRQAQILVPARAIWKYLDTGVAPVATWVAVGFNDAAWKTGATPIGYGVGDEASLASFGGNANNKRITTWFRRSFVVGDPADFYALVLGVRRNDGAVIYLNGQEIYRGNLPAGPITSSTLATNGTDWLDRQLLFERNVSATALVPGTNILAAEVHLRSASSGDMGFDFTLTGLAESQVRPRLSTAKNGSAVGLSWPANTGFFVPLTTTNLMPPILWQRTTNTPALTNGQWTVTFPAQNPSGFYRLQSQ